MQATILQTLQQHLCAIPEFNSHSSKGQYELTRLIQELVNPMREHALYEGRSYFLSTELQNRFGHGYKRFIEPFIDTDDHYSIADGITKSHILTEDVMETYNNYLDTNTGLSELLTMSGRIVRTPPKKTALTSMVNVNIREIEQCIRWLNAENKSLHLQSIDKVTKKGTILIKAAKLNLTGGSSVIQDYFISDYGRAYAKGGHTNLQNMPNIMLDAAMHDRWIYDMDTCHHVILRWLMHKICVASPKLDDYIENKSARRKQIASDVGITVGQAKMSMAALMYGSTMSLWGKAAIPDALGSVAKADQLYNHPIYKALHDEVNDAREKVITAWTRKNRQSIENVLGYRLGRNEPANKQMALILQGYEGQIMRLLVDMWGDVEVLKHDGMTTKGKHDVNDAEDKIMLLTGIPMMLSEGRHDWRENRPKFLSKVSP